jgi:hypothetical protein
VLGYFVVGDFCQITSDLANNFDPKNPTRHHTPDDDPEPGTPGTGEDICPECHGTGKQMDKKTGKPTDEPCERCDGTGIITEGVG